MKDIVNIYINGKEYICSKKALRTKEGASCIDYHLEWLRTTLFNISFSNGKKPIKFDLYVYYSDEINAFSKRNGDKEYMIGISSAVFLNLHNELIENFVNQDIRKYFYGKKKNAKTHAYSVCEYIYLFIALHEYYHILNGHLEISLNSNLLIEKSNVRIIDKEKNLQMQILELDADFCAVRSCIYLINEMLLTPEERINHYYFLGFALYYIFLIFQEGAYETFHIKDLLISDHPVASIRIIYSFSAMVLYMNCDYNLANSLEYYEIIWKITEVCIYYDRIYYDAETLDLSLTALGYSQKGMDHLNVLHEGWNDIKKKLEKVAYIKLKDNEKVDFKKFVWVDEKGDFIYKG